MKNKVRIKTLAHTNAHIFIYRRYFFEQRGGFRRGEEGAEAELPVPDTDLRGEQDGVGADEQEFESDGIGPQPRSATQDGRAAGYQAAAVLDRRQPTQHHPCSASSPVHIR